MSDYIFFGYSLVSSGNFRRIRGAKRRAENGGFLPAGWDSESDAHADREKACRRSRCRRDFPRAHATDNGEWMVDYLQVQPFKIRFRLYRFLLGAMSRLSVNFCFVFLLESRPVFDPPLPGYCTNHEFFR
jgi:hypothetical protein